MAQLLGQPGCMESLRADLRDLQAAIADVSSRAGAVRCPSWKFPEKVAGDLDMAELLERYQYRENDPQFSQHSHVVLLELVIDRLLLLLQSFTGYAELLLSERDVPPVQAVGPSMSAGLTARTYCCSMLKLGDCYQQLLAEKKVCRKQLPRLCPAPQAGHLEDRLPDILELTTSQGVAPSTLQFPARSVHEAGSNASGSSLLRAARSTAGSGHSVPTQATGSYLGPCNTCTSAQASLRQVGRAITRICQSQNIPSALGRLQEEELTSGRRTLSARDINCWASEQGKDIARLDRHLQLLLQQVTPLKAELAQAQREKEELQEQVEAFSRLLHAERENQERQRQEAERSLAAKSQEHSAAVARLEQEKDKVQRGTALFPAHGAMGPWLSLKATLLEEVRSATVARRQVQELQGKLQLLSSQQESLAQELSSTTTQLAKEKAKVWSVQRQQQALQAKQKALLQHLDSLDQERQELQSSLQEAEDKQAKLAEQLEESRQQSGQQLRAQQANVSKLEEQARELQEQERLLVFFPELHVPAEMQLESTGSVSEDMEQQMQANSIRIRVLQEENARLSSALAKLKAAAEQRMLQVRLHLSQGEL
ncbi:CC157 protein, partial [Todus mexicanus]|nr:CC157 protein [Todus mexicanus]